MKNTTKRPKEDTKTIIDNKAIKNKANKLFKTNSCANKEIKLARRKVLKSSQINS